MARPAIRRTCPACKVSRTQTDYAAAQSTALCRHCRRKALSVDRERATSAALVALRQPLAHQQPSRVPWPLTAAAATSFDTLLTHLDTVSV